MSNDIQVIKIFFKDKDGELVNVKDSVIGKKKRSSGVKYLNTTVRRCAHSGVGLKIDCFTYYYSFATRLLASAYTLLAALVASSNRPVDPSDFSCSPPRQVIVLCSRASISVMIRQ